MSTVRRRSGPIAHHCLWGPIATLLLCCAACFNPEGGGSGSTTSTTAADTTAPEASTSEPGAPTTSLPETSDTTSGSSSGPSSGSSSSASTSTSPTGDPATTSGTDDGTTGADLCHNGVIDDGEDCDGGAILDLIGCGDDCKRDGRLVFVTAEKFTGIQIGVAEGIMLCNQLGPQFEGLPTLTYTVWISEYMNSASTRIDESDLPFIRLDGTVVAETRDDFVKGPHLAPIDRTQAGMTIESMAGNCSDPETLVWTGTETTGEWAAQTCTNWSVDDPDVQGAIGTLNQFDPTWTFTCPLPCNTPARLYCVENP